MTKKQHMMVPWRRCSILLFSLAPGCVTIESPLHSVTPCACTCFRVCVNVCLYVPQHACSSLLSQTQYGHVYSQDALKKWIEKKSTPRLVSLDKNPVNKKPLSVMFADDKPKVIGILPIESDKITEFKEALISASDAHDDLHVRLPRLL